MARVRTATEGDFDSMFDLASAVAEEDKWVGAQAPLDRATTLAQWYEALDDEHEALLVVEADGRILGMATVHLRIGIASFTMQLAGDARGRGIGTVLLDAILDWARARRAHKVTLEMWPHNHGAHRLYERAGFVEEGRRRRHYRRRSGELWDSVIMGLVLDDASPGSRFAAEE